MAFFPPLRLVALGPLLLATSAARPAAPAVVPAAPPTVAPPAPLRWTDETPDAMVVDAAARATLPGAPEGDVLAAALVIRALDPRAENGRAEQALHAIARKVTGPVAGDIALLARSLADDEGSAAGTLADRSLGVITDLAILGPFRDTGGGLDLHEGPEAGGGSFADASTRYAWGTVDVAWRKVPPHYVTAGGVPLDLFIAPRTESCTLLATAITVTVRQSLELRIASSGSVRVIFDGADVAHSSDVNVSALADRLAVTVDATAGDHLVAAKVCTGALADDGRVRLRILDTKGSPAAVTASADLTRLPPHPPAHATGNLHGTHLVGTPLLRALAPATSGIEPLLDAAIVRTLGGADDTRSPRAPGILDDITHHDGLDPDRLAMMGWISPSGANRSSMLDLALSRAAGVDPRAHAFAERRLIAQRMNARLVDWAMATALGANLGHSDAEAVLMYALLDDALGTDALRTDALRSLESFGASNNPGKAPTSLLRELAHLAASYDQAMVLNVREVLAQRGERGHELVEALGARSGGAVAEAAKTAFDGNLDDASDGLAVAEALARAGRHDEAKAAYVQMVEWAPNRSEAWSGLATELALGGAKAQGARLEALRRARELAPGEAGLRAELALVQGATSGPTERQESHASAHDDEKYLVAPDVFLVRRKGARAGIPDVADRELYWLRAVVLHPDRRVSQLIQYAREVVIPPRTQEELVEDLPAEGDLTEILRARVHRKNGGIAFPTEQHDEGSRPSIRWPELEPGDTVEVALRTWTREAVGGRGNAPFTFMDYAGSTTTHPLLYNEVVVEAPKTSPLYIDVLHGDADRRTEHDEGDRHVIRLVWDRPALIADEPLAPNLSEIAPVIVGSSFKTWADFRTWYTGAVQGFTVPDDEVRRLAATLTRGKPTREAKLEALFDFVADDIRYVNFTSGEFWLPNRPQQLLARREGDCDDKAILLITLLRAVGIEAEEVMVQTRERGESSVILAKNAVIPLFDHGIAFLPGPGGGQYLDATSPESRLGPLPSMDARAPAFRLESGPAEITMLPASSPADHGTSASWSIQLRPDGSGDLVGEESSVGDAAFWLRTALTQPDGRGDYVRDHLVSPWLPTVVVDKKVEFKGDLARGAAWVKYAAHAVGVARREQDELTLTVGQSQGLTSKLASLLTRTLPVSLPPQLAPSHQERTTRITAPAGFAWASLPTGGDENGGEFGRAHLELTKDPREPRTLVVRRTVVFDQHLISAAKYPAWRAWLQRVDRLMHKEVRLHAG
jgi:tetratricopeptide (TPR) repeat protein